MATELVPITKQNPNIDDLAQRIASYTGGAHRVLMALLRDPGCSTQRMLEIAGIARPTYTKYRHYTAGFRAIVDIIRDSQVSLNTTYAQAAISEAIPNIVDTQIARATTKDAKDSQRAGERLLESAGVLNKDQPVAAGEFDSLEVIAMRLFRKRAS